MQRLTLAESDDIMLSDKGKYSLDIYNKLSELLLYTNNDVFRLGNYRIELENDGFIIEEKKEKILFAGWRLFFIQIRKPKKDFYYIERIKFYKNRIIYSYCENNDMLLSINEYLAKQLEKYNFNILKCNIEKDIKYADAEYIKDNTLSYEEWDRLYGRVAY